MMMDKDGDTPPCSAMWDLKHAQAWDDWKQKKYGGSQKAEPMVLCFKRMEARYSSTLTPEPTPSPPRSWIQRLWHRVVVCILRR